MFQTFDTPSDPSQGPMRLAQLRDVLRTEALDGFIVPRADAHQGEYVGTGCKTCVVDRLYRLGRILRRAYGLRWRVCRRALSGAGQTTSRQLF